MLERRIPTSYQRVTLNVILGIKSTTVRLWTVMMKITCKKRTWVDELRVVYIGGTLKQRRNEQHITSRMKQCQKLHSSLV